MKIRDGFVSNSSSTIYILWIPAKVTAKKLTDDAISKIKGATEEVKEATRPLFMELFKVLKAGALSDYKRSDMLKEAGLLNQQTFKKGVGWVTKKSKIKDADEIVDIIINGLDPVLHKYVIYGIDSTDSEGGLFYNAASAKTKIANLESKAQ